SYSDGRGYSVRARNAGVGRCRGGRRDRESSLNLGNRRQPGGETPRLVQARARVVRIAGFGRHVRAQDQPFRAAAPHTAFEALPLAGAGVRHHAPDEVAKGTPELRRGGALATKRALPCPCSTGPT